MVTYSRSDRMLVVSYAVLAVGALAGTQIQLVRHFLQDDAGGLWGFVTDAYANPAAAFMALDVTFVALAALVLMVAEAVRLKIKHVWVFVAIAFLVAISVAFPLFLIERQRRLAQLGAAQPVPAA